MTLGELLDSTTRPEPSEGDCCDDWPAAHTNQEAS